MNTMRDLRVASAVRAEQTELFARNHPLLLYVGHTVRAAAAMSLLLLLIDVGWPTEIDSLERLRFVVFWAAGVSVFSVLDARFGVFRLFAGWLERARR